MFKKIIIISIILILLPAVILFSSFFFNANNQPGLIREFSPNVSIYWHSRITDNNDPYAMYKFAALENDYETVDEVYIWADLKPYAYLLGVEKGYIKINYLNNNIDYSKDINHFKKEDIMIFKKLQSHTEVFFHGQQLSNKQRTLQDTEGKGELILQGQ